MWFLDPAAKVATVIAVVIALSPHLRRAWRLLTRTDQTTQDIIEHFDFMRSGRVGWKQRLWYSFLDWCRTENLEKLSWREWWARNLCCHLISHDIKKTYPPGRFHGVCKNCHAIKLTETEEALDEWARRGAIDYWDRDVRWRMRRRKGKKVSNPPDA